MNLGSINKETINQTKGPQRYLPNLKGSEIYHVLKAQHRKSTPSWAALSTSVLSGGDGGILTSS